MHKLACTGPHFEGQTQTKSDKEQRVASRESHSAPFSTLMHLVVAPQLIRQFHLKQKQCPHGTILTTFLFSKIGENVKETGRQPVNS